MQPGSSSSPSRASSIVGLLSIAAVCAGFVVGWVLERNVGYLVAAAGALVVAPVWFEAPPRFNAPLTAAPRRLSKLSIVLTAIGYPLVLAGVLMRLMT
jgi:hypothetical protein